MLVALAGLPASGKSTLARRLTAALPVELPGTPVLSLDKDALRAFLFDGHVDYSGAQNDLVVDIAYQVAAYLHRAQTEPIVLIDGRTFSERRQVEALKGAASGMGTSLVIIECHCSEDEARRRFAQDDGTHPAADRDVALHLRRRATAEPIVEPKLSLDTGALSLERCVARATAHVRAARDAAPHP